MNTIVAKQWSISTAGWVSAGRRCRGFTLVELMIALVLGLLVIAGVGSVFVANKDAYRTNEALSQAQDAARTSFEFIARDIRAAGSNPCGTGGVQSALNGSAQCGGTNDLPNWLDDFDVPVFGTENPSDIDGLPASGAGSPEAGTDAIRIGKADDLGIRLDELQPAPNAANLKLAAPTTLIDDDDVVMVCEAGKATIFQVSSYAGNLTVVHNSGNGSGSIGNCTKGLNHDVYDDPNGNGTTLGTSSYLAVPRSVYWYIGANSAGTTSLYRARNNQNLSDPADPSDSIEIDEMVRGVENMQLSYHQTGEDDFVNAGSVSNWGDVDAVHLELTVRSRGVSASDPSRGAGSDRQRLQRDFSTTIAIRNRLEG